MSDPFTPEFIRMARFSREIQLLRLDDSHFNPGDWYWNSNEGALVVENYGPMRTWMHWLPRLDQLLGMVGDFISWQGVRDFDGPLRSINASPDTVVDWHELAMAVVMREKYEKKWDGGKWVAAA